MARAVYSSYTRNAGWSVTEAIARVNGRVRRNGVACCQRTKLRGNTMLIIILLLAFLSGVYIGSRFFATRDVQ